MSDDHYPIECEACGTRPALVRLGSQKPTEHSSFGVECECTQSDGVTPVGSFVDVNTLPDEWRDDADPKISGIEVAALAE